MSLRNNLFLSYETYYYTIVHSTGVETSNGNIVLGPLGGGVDNRYLSGGWNESMQLYIRERISATGMWTTR